MKLSKLYSNRPEVFEAVEFVPGLNVVLAEIRLPQNRKKDTHNLGKSTLGRLIDFGLLSKKDAAAFLFEHQQLFEGFVFFLELELLDGGYFTIRRGVNETTKIAFKRHQDPWQDFSDLVEKQWDHVDLPFDRAKELLDGVLDLRAIKPWNYRKGLGYLLRSQDDYNDVFKLRHGHKHLEWKPFLALMLGFDAKLVQALYEKEEALADKQVKLQAIRAELGGTSEDLGKIEGLLLLKQKEASKKQELLNAFDFRAVDKDLNEVVVDEVDARIEALNAERYSLSLAKRKIASSLEEDQVLFDPGEAQQLFSEMGLTFPNQLKRDYEQLIAFNRAITDERRQYLAEERAEIEVTLKKVSAELSKLGRKRVAMLSFLKEADVFAKYRQVSEELVTLKADIASLERQRGFLHRLQEMRVEIRALTEEKGHLQTQIERDVAKQESNGASLFSSIRLLFSEIVEEVIDRKALLTVVPNQHGHLDFKVEILDESGSSTSADRGHSYRKLLCVAFDMAVLRAHLEVPAARFAFHDGVFEALDDRKKVNLLSVMREYASLGLQFVITLIDSELPAVSTGSPALFGDDEIVVRLHDEGPSGRLFKMAQW